jgi:hypothetical protein
MDRAVREAAINATATTRVKKARRDCAGDRINAGNPPPAIAMTSR